MNYLAHHEIARQLSPEQDVAFRFGSIVPDFVNMFHMPEQFKQEEGLTNTRLRVGIRFHYVTKHMFDKHPEVQELEMDMKRSFRQFMPRYAGTQCAFAGKDMLVDGIFTGDSIVQDSIRSTLETALETKPYEGLTSPLYDFYKKLAVFALHGPPDFSNPGVVAYLLQRRLEGTRAGFGVEYVPQLAEALVPFHDRAMEIGRPVLNRVIANFDPQKATG